jgi:hypothetical protein
LAIKKFPQHLRYVPIGNSNAVLLSISSTGHLAVVILFSICYLAILLMVSNLQFTPFCHCNTYCPAQQYSIRHLETPMLATSVLLSFCNKHQFGNRNSAQHLQYS